MEPVLVTGGLGFIGTQVVECLRAQGRTVVVYDWRVSDEQPAKRDGVTFLQGDVRDGAALAEALQGVTGIVHLAAQVSVAQSVRNPHETFLHNVVGTQMVFEAARLAGTKRIVYASSAAVYGDSKKTPKEEADTLSPISPYAASKEINERIAAVYARTYGVSSCALRFFNVYGPGQKADHAQASVIPRWIAAIKKGGPIAVYGDGAQTRDFVQVRDVARAVVSALEGSGSGVYNVASGTETSLKQVLALLQTVHGSEFPVVFEPSREGDIVRSMASIEKIKGELGWVPQVAFEAGIRELVS